MSLDTLLKDTLLSLYRDSPEITYALLQCDFTAVSRKFREELFARISPDKYYHMDALLHSEEYYEYRDAIDRASLAVTNDLADLMEFTLAQNEGKLN